MCYGKSAGAKVVKHLWKAEGYGVRIRPVGMEDAAFIVWLRNLEHTRGKLGDSAASVADQEAWLRTYLTRDDDFYFIAETLGGIPVGTHGLYGLADGSAEAGRLIIRPDVPAAPPTSFITFDLAFGEMGLKELRGTSVSTNKKVHTYVEKFGFRQTRVDVGAKAIAGKPVDIVHFAMTAEEWAKNRPGVIPLVKYAEKQTLAWEKTQPPEGERPWMA
jgi:RimJ/RimL family protein N-acetyltransferase